MTKETYCNFEISKWLKAKGFDCKASEIYMEGGEALSVRNIKLTNKQLNAINCVVRATHEADDVGGARQHSKYDGLR